MNFWHHLYTICIIYYILKRKLARKFFLRKPGEWPPSPGLLINPLGLSVSGFRFSTPQWVQARGPCAMHSPWAQEPCCSTLSPGTCQPSECSTLGYMRVVTIQSRTTGTHFTQGPWRGNQEEPNKCLTLGHRRVGSMWPRATCAHFTQSPGTYNLK